jgi:hypothetical protein
MAIDPSSMGMDPDEDPSGGAPADDSGQGMDMSKGYCIELKVKADGSMTVGVEPLDEEMSEEAGAAGSSGAPADPSADPSEAGETDDDAQPVSSLGDAIRVIKDIVAHAGDMTEMANSQDAMSSGYGKAGS